MSRRKQSKPRQIKRSVGDLEEGDDNLPDEHSLSGEEAGASDQDDSAECEDSSPSFGPLYNEEPTTNESPGTPEVQEEKEPHWSGPDELELCVADGDAKVRARQRLLIDTVWGPYRGKIQQEDATEEQAREGPTFKLLLEDEECWLLKLSFSSSEGAANSTVYSKGEEVYCKLTQGVSEGECLTAVLTASPAEESTLSKSSTARVKEESLPYPAALHSDIQLLPQQAGMAAILATAVVNKDIFPCKDCGIWYRSERNLQAHLMYYCASRQRQEPSSPPQEKPKDSYPNERVCPFPHCNKSCPSASSLEIHMRTHSGERPFVCLICLSAFTTKANCERHLKVHTDTLNGVCHGCGYVSTTRDILYSHLVTSHMVCQPGSKSEVSSPGPGVPAIPLAAGLSPTESGAAVKCQLCGLQAESPASLQQHMLTHVEGKVQNAQSPAPVQSPPNPLEQPERQEKNLEGSVSLPESASPGTDGGVITPREGSPAGELSAVKIKEEPKSAKDSDSENEAEDSSAEGRAQEKTVNDSSSQTSSPKSLHSIKVKTELSSPTPGSSPVHFGTGSMIPGGTVFLPQYMFSTEASIVPQASEILAKMSEMVHSRLKQGQSGAPPFYAGSPIQKGATCFECDITFNNINNYYVHKRLYCSSRHQQGENPMALPHAKDNPTASVPAAYSSPPPAAGSRAPSSSHSDTETEPSGSSMDAKAVEVKTEDPGLKDTSSEGESGSRVSEGSQSPSNSVEDIEDDPTKTFCEACNIRFSRHENYMVHKRYYCASRHDPPNQRTRSGKVTFLPQPVRTRKRRKLYEIHMARNEALGNPTLSIKQEPIAMVGRPLDPSPMPVAMITAAGTGTVPSPSSSPEGDGPIDLSKKPRLQEDQLPIPVLPLTDYHKCTACSISFNSIENYLAHKTYYCPATTLQQKTFEQLHRMKRSSSNSPKARIPEKADFQAEHLDIKGIKTEKNPLAVPVPSPACTNSTTLPGTSLPSSEGVTPHQTAFLKALPVLPNTSPVVCPYCPLNGAIKGDLMEHFKNVHGLLLTMQAIGHAAQAGNLKEVSQQSRHQSESQPAQASPIPSPRIVPNTPPKLGFKSRNDNVNGREMKETGSPSSPVVNGNPAGPSATSPKLAPPVSPAAATAAAVSLNISPVPEVLREASLKPLTPPLLADKPTPAPKGTAPPVQNGNSRYCRLCNIKFSSLSTFIAHKKYYCSSHSAEHVK
nr:PREDICTED: zinc finger protein ZFPM1 isoform X1 [Lepisosteus oculatus]